MTSSNLIALLVPPLTFLPNLDFVPLSLVLLSLALLSLAVSASILSCYIRNRLRIFATVAILVVLFLNELEEIMELIDLKELTELRDPLFKCIAQCLSSEHFQVAERTLFLWNNEHLVNVSVAIIRCARELRG
jgi:hypothetical protein